jgi:hypothetical protein
MRSRRMAVLEQSRDEEEWAEERLVEQKRLADEEKGPRPPLPLQKFQ